MAEKIADYENFDLFRFMTKIRKL